jgi:hypothetical protein
MRTLVVIILSALFPLAAHAANVDLGIDRTDISFSEEILVAGDQVRIYAAVHNVGNVDVAGYVSFYQGSVPIGDSQVISVRANGVAEEVFVDFVVPSGTFNIRAEIRGTDPEDENAENDVAITGLFTPVLDDDRDGVPNEEDNCPDTSNADQKDSDNDGEGNACDEDDDNDGVTDDVEKEIGSNPENADTDGDGISDAKDARPTQAGEPAPTPAPTTAPQNEPAEAIDKETVEMEEAPTSDEIASSNESEPEDEEEEAQPVIVQTSPNAVFTYERRSWNTYFFRAQKPNADGYRVEWNFGDGVTSNRDEVEHTYRTSGEFRVSVRVTAPDGTTAEDATTIQIPFFTWENRMIKFLVAILVLLLILGIIAWVHFRKTPIGPDSERPTKKEKKEMKKAKLEEGNDEEGLQEDPDNEGPTHSAPGSEHGTTEHGSRVIVRMDDEEDTEEHVRIS